MTEALVAAGLLTPIAARMLPGGTNAAGGMMTAHGLPATLLTVIGNGEVQVAPDTAQVTLGVTVLAPTAQEAQAQATEVLRRIVQVVQGLGIPAEQVRTATVSLSPEFEQPGPTARAMPPRVVGFRANTTLTVTLRRFEQIGTLIDQAVQAGANEVQGVVFLLQDPQQAQLRALQAAVTDALRKGNTLAQRLGQRVISVRSAQIGTPPSGIPVVQFARAEVGLPIFPGAQPVRVDVTLELLAR